MLPASSTRTQERGTTPYGPAIAAGLVVLVISLLGPNVALVSYAAVVLALGICLLWRPAEPPIMLFVFAYQWLQASTGAIYGNFAGLRPEDFAQHLGEHQLACALELTGTLVLALGMRFAVGRNSFGLHERMVPFVASRPVGFWFRLYLGAAIFSALCSAVAFSAGGLAQVLLSLAQVKWAAYVLLTFATFAVPGRSKFIWFGVTALEFGLSVGGFFSSFKDVFFYAFLGLVGSGLKIRPQTVVLLVCGAALVVILGVVWSAVKQDYRDYVSSNETNQSVNVSRSESLRYIGKLVSDLDGRQLATGADRLAQRLMYTEFFGAVLVNVPENVPHTHGALWGDAVVRTVTPRLIFTDKTPVHDSELTRQYTGIQVSSYDQGTSISMGYMAEAYIDFGAILMFVPIFLLGGAMGLIYRWLLSAPARDGVIGAGLACFTLMPAFALETSILKLIPAIGLCAIACIVIFKFLTPLIWGVLNPAGRLRKRAQPPCVML